MSCLPGGYYLALGTFGCMFSWNCGKPGTNDTPVTFDESFSQGQWIVVFDQGVFVCHQEDQVVPRGCCLCV